MTKATDPECVKELILRFALKQLHHDLEEIHDDISLLDRSPFSFEISIAGDQNNSDSHGTRLVFEGSLKEALTNSITTDSNDHPAYLDPSYFTVILLTYSGKKIILPEIFWEEVLHEILHELNEKHLDWVKVTPQGAIVP